MLLNDNLPVDKKIALSHDLKLYPILSSSVPNPVRPIGCVVNLTFTCIVHMHIAVLTPCCRYSSDMVKHNVEWTR